MSDRTIHKTPSLRLGIPGFVYADLFSPHGLCRLHNHWLSRLAQSDPALKTRYDRYRQGESLSELAQSTLLIDLAGTVSQVIEEACDDTVLVGVEVLAAQDPDLPYLQQRTQEAEDLAAAFASGKNPYEEKKGVVYRAYRSRLDGQLQPYLALVPRAFEKSRRFPLILGMHGLNGQPGQALRTVLGTHVAQKGSLVGPDRLRFDFSHTRPLTHEQRVEIERRVNAEVLRNHDSQTRNLSMAEAKETGAIGLFEAKYGEVVRVINIGGESIELCGGTHVARAGDIGLFAIVSETGIAQGVRRIEAVTGMNALAYLQQTAQIVGDARKNGVKVREIDVSYSHAQNTLEEKDGAHHAVRLGSRPNARHQRHQHVRLEHHGLERVPRVAAVGGFSSRARHTRHQPRGRPS